MEKKGEERKEEERGGLRGRKGEFGKGMEERRNVDSSRHCLSDQSNIRRKGQESDHLSPLAACYSRKSGLSTYNSVGTE